VQTVVARKRVTALIVDDHRDTRKLYTDYLSKKGVDTVEAEDGMRGLAKAHSMVPDVIATDIRLPFMTGVELCHSLKQQDTTRDIPIIAVTGCASYGEIDAALSAGCVSVLLKPCLPEELFAEIQRVLKANRSVHCVAARDRRSGG